MKKLVISLMAAMILPLSMFCSCSNDETDVREEDRNPDEIVDPGYDGLEWFRDCIVATDSLENFVSLMHGSFLKPSEPKTVSIVVESFDEAAELFRSWVAPTAVLQLTESENGTITYLPQSEEGTPEGIITYTPDASSTIFASVSFSEGISFPEFDRIEFIRKPMNVPPGHHDDDTTDGYSIGDRIAKPNGYSGAYVVREATAYQSGLAVCLYGDVTGDTALNVFYLPKEPTAQLVQKIFANNWNILSSIEPAYSPDRPFWYNKKSKFMFVNCYLHHLNLHTGETGKNDYMTGSAKRGGWEVYSFTVSDHNTKNID